MNERNLKKALETNIDYSAEFTSLVEKMGTELSSHLQASVSQDRDMNYKAAQELNVYLTSDFQIAYKLKNSEFWIRIFISSRGLFASLIIKSRFQHNVWVTVALNDAPKQVQNMYKKITKFLQDQNYSVLSTDILEEIVPDRYREIDDLPATVFDILFAEEV